MRDPSDVENWRADAKCITMDTEMWYPPRDKDLYKPIADKAKSVCLGKDGKPACSVRLECLLYADSMGDTYGIWGGMSHRERNALKRKAKSNGKTLAEWVEGELQ